MGLQKITIIWDVTIKERHEFVINRQGGFWDDRFAVLLDDEVLFTHKFNANSLEYAHHFTVDDRPATIRCLWGIKGDPMSITLVVDDVLVALYGNRSALDDIDVDEDLQCQVESVTCWWGRGKHDILRAKTEHPDTGFDF